MSLFRASADGFARKLSLFAALTLVALLLVSASAQAFPRYGGWGGGDYRSNPASPQVNEELAVCPGQTFFQPFTAFGDENFYTLVGGSEFNSESEGWLLGHGAEVVTGQRPDGSTGGVLDLPSGAWAVSPPVCVTLQYPSARTWVQTVDGGGGLSVGVSYLGARSWGARPFPVALLGSDQEGEWALSDPFSIRPDLGGSGEGAREARFVFSNWSWRSSEFRVSGLFVDPRMR